MKLRRIKHMLLRLSPEEKLAGVGAILVLVSAFLPWFSVTFSSVEKANTVSGFAGDLGVIGFIVFLTTAMALAFLMADHLHIRLPNFGFKKDQILLFLLGESAFLLLLTVAIYTKRSFDYTNAEIRFGLYLALIGAFMGAVSAFSQIQKKQKKETEAFFGQEEAEEAITSAQEEPTPNEAEGEEERPYKEVLAEQTKVTQEEPEPAEQKSFFYEEQEAPQEAAVQEDIVDEMEEVEPETEPAAEPVEPASSDVEKTETEGSEAEGEETEVPEVTEPEPEEAEEEPAAEEELAPSEEEPIRGEIPPLDQGDYLIRDAGVQPKNNIKVDMDSVRRVDQEEQEEIKAGAEPDLAAETKEEAKETHSDNMSFYDDL